jgi:hypothetical protein
MINVETKTKLSPSETVNKAIEFFGPGNLGLKVRDQCGDCITFEGGGGYVEISVTPEEKKTKVEIVAQEWEFQVNEFIDQIAR